MNTLALANALDVARAREQRHFAAAIAELIRRNLAVSKLHQLLFEKPSVKTPTCCTWPDCVCRSSTDCVAANRP
jgi:hypothetical protein